MDSRDRSLIGQLRELHLLLSVAPVMPDRRTIDQYMLYKERQVCADVVNAAIERILNG